MPQPVDHPIRPSNVGHGARALQGSPVPADERPDPQVFKELDMSYYCSECVVNWSPYQTDQGCCPKCGGGTVRRQEPESDDAHSLFRSARAEAAKRELHASFEVYYAEREQERRAA
jgi:hypothetical protein